MAQNRSRSVPWGWQATALLLAALAPGCGRGEPPADVPVETCIAAVKASATQPDSTLAGRSIASACAPLYAEPACQDGFASAWDEATSPAERARILVEACSKAYCPKLAEPRPALCAQPATDLAARSKQWQEFQRTVLAKELGPARAERVLSAMKTAGDARLARDR